MKKEYRALTITKVVHRNHKTDMSFSSSNVNLLVDDDWLRRRNVDPTMIVVGTNIQVLSKTPGNNSDSVLFGVDCLEDLQLLQS